jgi:hypothetical protein
MKKFTLIILTLVVVFAGAGYILAQVLDAPIAGDTKTEEESKTGNDTETPPATNSVVENSANENPTTNETPTSNTDGVNSEKAGTDKNRITIPNSQVSVQLPDGWFIREPEPGTETNTRGSYVEFSSFDPVEYTNASQAYGYGRPGDNNATVLVEVLRKSTDQSSPYEFTKQQFGSSKYIPRKIDGPLRDPTYVEPELVSFNVLTREGKNARKIVLKEFPDGSVYNILYMVEFGNEEYLYLSAYYGHGDKAEQRKKEIEAVISSLRLSN